MVLRLEASNKLCNLRLGRIADHPGNTRERSEFLRSALSVAAGDDYLSGGVLCVDLANGVAGLRVGSGRHGTGIHDDYVGGCSIARRGQSAIEQLTFDGGGVGLCSAAAELFDVEGRHFA